jgi:hypothetical protein
MGDLQSFIAAKPTTSAVWVCKAGGTQFLLLLNWGKDSARQVRFCPVFSVEVLVRYEWIGSSLVILLACSISIL